MHATNLNKQRKVVPDGPHTVMAFKTKKEVESATHFVSHVYTAGLRQFNLRRMTTARVQGDWRIKRNGKVAWPNHNLDEWERAGPAHNPTRRARFGGKQKVRAPDADGRRAPFGGKQKVGAPDADGFQMVARGRGGNTKA